MNTKLKDFENIPIKCDGEDDDDISVPDDDVLGPEDDNGEGPDTDEE